MLCGANLPHTRDRLLLSSMILKEDLNTRLMMSGICRERGTSEENLPGPRKSMVKDRI